MIPKIIQLFESPNHNYNTTQTCRVFKNIMYTINQQQEFSGENPGLWLELENVRKDIRNIQDFCRKFKRKSPNIISLIVNQQIFCNKKTIYCL